MKNKIVNKKFVRLNFVWIYNNKNQVVEDSCLILKTTIWHIKMIKGFKMKKIEILFLQIKFILIKSIQLTILKLKIWEN